MRKRLKSKDEVCHYWYHKIQSEGHLGNVFFEGDSIYSYGKHFEMARHVKVGRKVAVLLSTRTYSPTTTSHQSEVRRAIPSDAVIIRCYDSRIDVRYNHTHDDNITAWIRAVNDALKKLAVARKPSMYLSQIESIQAEARIYIDFFKVKLSKEKRAMLFPNISKAVAEVLPKVRAEQARNLEYRKQWEAKEAERRRIRELSLEERRAEFRSGKLQSYTNSGDYDESLLRMNGDTLQTSKGIEIPRAVAKRFYKKVMTAWNTGASLVGEKILDFEIREFTPEYFRAGCHRISKEEVERLTPVLG